MRLTSLPGRSLAIERKISMAIRRSMERDSVEKMLSDYRPLTVDDVLEWDVHWLGPVGRSGRIQPLHETNRLQVRSLQVLRGFLYRVSIGRMPSVTVTAGEEDAQRVRTKGTLEYCGEITSFSNPPELGVIYKMIGPEHGYRWRRDLFRRDGTLSVGAVRRVSSLWSPMTTFWRGSSGPHVWRQKNGRYLLADTDGWGCPVFETAVVRTVPRPGPASEEWSAAG